jgi:GTPase SAR1 family protein
MVGWIQRVRETLPQSRRWSDIAVLYRKHRHREQIVERLRKQGVPYATELRALLPLFRQVTRRPPAGTISLRCWPLGAGTDASGASSHRRSEGGRRTWALRVTTGRPSKRKDPRGRAAKDRGNPSRRRVRPRTAKRSGRRRAGRKLGAWRDRARGRSTTTAASAGLPLTSAGQAAELPTPIATELEVAGSPEVETALSDVPLSKGDAPMLSLAVPSMASDDPGLERPYSPVHRRRVRRTCLARPRWRVNLTAEEQPPAARAPARPAAAAESELLDRAAQAFRSLARDDLVRRLSAAKARLQRPSTVVCVVGEFKQGKSSLINALLAGRVCPVDDDLATSALTVVHFGDALKVVVRRRADGEQVVEAIDPATLNEWVTEQGNRGNQRAVERVDIALPHPLLRDGLILVDTPGMGGIGAGHGAATLAFLPYADGLIFVSDATAELSAPEVTFLKQSLELCPTVVFALTKTDLVPHWRRIHELNRGHLADAGLDLPVLPIASPLRHAAMKQGDPALEAESGIPALVNLLATDVIAPAKRLAARRARTDVHSAVSQVLPSLNTELAMLEDPARQAQGLAELQAARSRLDHLRGPGARWSQLLADRMADLSNEATYGLRRSVRELQRQMEGRLEEIKTPADWEDLSRELRTATAGAVTHIIGQLEAGADAIQQDVRAMLAEESLEAGELRALGRSIDVSALWGDTRIDEGVHRAGRVAGTALTGLRGAQSGIFMVSIFARFLPAGMAGILMANPVSLGLGAVFAGHQLIDANRRRLGARRQKARVSVSRFLDDVQFEVGNQLGDMVRQLQRELRDNLTERIGELHRSYAGALERAQADATRSQQQREARSAVLREQIALLERVSTEAGAGDARAARVGGQAQP